MRIDVVSLFPDFVRQCAAVGVVGRAQQRQLLQVEAWNPRDYTSDRHRTVDASSYGGGPGMVMMIEPLRATLAAVRGAAPEPAHVIYLSPQGPRLTQGRVEALAKMPRIALLCGRYEGVDERLLAHEVDEELSIGDYVLSGGELAAAVIIDAVGRLQEGALNDALSAEQDSFANGLLDCPHYAKPVQDALGTVPEVLLSGDHAAIARWRLKQSLGRTWLRRPDLLSRCVLDKTSRALLDEFRREHASQALSRQNEAVDD
ncbi:tRNA (guanine-N1)-methyltransferase [Rhodanobacter sp. Root480]|uniref:tRNA (guanosine(37)-N1)-methyltransferase TrmD n=1 Tax=unclassified Rhodanobacter TaxID=2621553 RepID=UPI0006F77705|nr:MULTISPECIES: tRNA (guanosine(37)-N1)-methyltransferase TrmD [unclassified Rhodanobacter]KQX95182.1 tRNA (guanine-N1)-methyltransferase [Rhodanobacter sp. Root480]KRA30183.1 tRNA (guanine-N1)-methyltransferase [Rhodanobacter sp. Root627]